MIIRQGRCEDWEKVDQLLRQIWQGDYVGDSWLGWVQQPTAGVVLVAEENDLIVGTCYIKFRSSLDCWFQAMRVHPGYRRMGVGSRLTEAALQAARGAGMQSAYLGIDADNQASLAMTERAGFQRLTEYRIFRPKRELAAPGDTHRWRLASSTDMPTIVHLITAQHQREETPLALFGCWEWQALSHEALQGWVDQQALWVWEDDGVKVTASIAVFDTEAHLFAPSGTPQEMMAALDDFLSLARAKEATDIHIWLPTASSLTAALERGDDDGSEASDGYVIWKYQLG